ncbi:Na(+)/H(+) antiporter 1 [uncultured archaeon]|nr:Na(+)/H(+) antiporter 1 [uncultured archaeon]
MEISTVILFVGLLIFLAHLFSGLFERTRIPDVLPLVFIGLLLGPLFGFITPETFGQVGNVFISITLVVILFESGIGLNFSTLRNSFGGGIKLTVINFVVTSMAVTTIVIPSGMSILNGLILGAILGGTSSAVVIPIVGKLRLQESTRTSLILESTFSDVLCIVVTLALIQAATSNDLKPIGIFGNIIASFFLAAIIGGFFALLWASILSTIRRLENSIFLTPAFVFIIYGMTEMLGYSGAIASLTFGVTLGNIRSIPFVSSHGLKLPLVGGRAIQFQPISLNKTEKTFFAEVVFLLKTFFFVYLGLSIRLNALNIIIVGLLFTLIMFTIRIPIVRLSMNKTTPKLDASLAAVIVPKGLAAAVLASLPLQAGILNGQLMQDIVYSVILFSIIATAILTFLIEINKIKQPYTRVFSKYA